MFENNKKNLNVYFSLSSDAEVHVSVLLTCVKVLCKLYTSVYQSMTASIQAAAVNGVTPVSQKAVKIFKVCCFIMSLTTMTSKIYFTILSSYM